MADFEILVAADSDVPVHVSTVHSFATGANLSAGYFSITAQNLAFAARFRAVPIPRGARIRSAVIRLEAATTLADVVVNARIDALAAGDTETPTHAEFDGGVIGAADHGRNINNRTRAQVLWSGIAAITNGVDFDTPDLSPIVQEITSRSDWVQGNAMTLFLGDEDKESDQVNDHYRSALRASVGPRLLVTFAVGSDPAKIRISLAAQPRLLGAMIADEMRRAEQVQVA